MRKVRKGFTLVELLIVVAILAILSAVMTASITGQTAKAKASAILNNVAAFKKAAEYYYAQNWEDASKIAVTAKAVITDAGVLANTASDTGVYTDGSITYTPDSTETNTGVDKWFMTVDFSNDGEAAAIATELQKRPSYTTTTTAGNKFKVTLYTGEISAAAAASGSGTNGGNQTPTNP